MTYDYNPYRELGISPEATEKEIKRAYHKLAQRLHPDKNRIRAAEKQFQRINNAYNLLMDPVQRRQYEEHQSDREGTSSGYFTMRVTPSKRAFAPIPEAQVVYLLTEIMASPDAERSNKADVNLNLTLIIDQSNSMSDENRMKKVKAAAQEIIGQLKPQDILSVVSFNDRANVVIPAQNASDPNKLKARISMMKPFASTAMYEGLNAGLEQNLKYLNKNMVNHIILLTDGHTYGDEDECISLAQRAKDKGISLTAMGLGTDWNDKFLDQLASTTGGNSIYVNSINLVRDFLDDQIRSLSNAYAERMELVIAPDQDVMLEMAFKLSPSPQPLVAEDGVIPLGSLQPKRPIAVLMQLQLPGDMDVDYRSMARITAEGDILQNRPQAFQAVSDLTIEVTETPATDEKPPSVIVDALSKLTLYRLQEKAQEALENGDIDEATRQLEYLSTRLYNMGEEQLGKQAMLEAHHVKNTKTFTSAAGKLTLKYTTRSLVGTSGLQDLITSMFDQKQQAGD